MATPATCRERVEEISNDGWSADKSSKGNPPTWTAVVIQLNTKTIWMKIGANCSSQWAKFREIWLVITQDPCCYPFHWHLNCSNGINSWLGQWEAERSIIINKLLWGQDKCKDAEFAFKSLRQSSWSSMSLLIRHLNQLVFRKLMLATLPSIHTAVWVYRKSGHGSAQVEWHIVKEPDCPWNTVIWLMQ